MESFDTPPKLELITFDTPFAGKFGLIICFDILFHDPTVALVKMVGSFIHTDLIFSTAWMNALPLLDSIQFHRAFSLGANVTVLSSNLRNEKHRMTGSGIYTPFSATFYHAVNRGPEEGRLLVTKSDHCHRGRCADSPSPGSSFTGTMAHDLYNFVLLNETQGNLRVCDSTFCCHLQYKWTAHNKSKELYALGAFAGMHNGSIRYAVQVCAVVRCAGLEASSCGQHVLEAESKMDFLLEATFQTDYVYPSVLMNCMEVKQPDKLEKTTGGRVAMKYSNLTGGLITACLYGRMYQLDHLPQNNSNTLKLIVFLLLFVFFLFLICKYCQHKIVHTRAGPRYTPLQRSFGD
uniref:Biotinidase n=1 Tax=Poecilia latipinna TaxID=48699 RepID=A0A3B3VV88_9TELE